MFLPIFLYLHQKIPEERWFEACRAGVPPHLEPEFYSFRRLLPILFPVCRDTFPGMKMCFHQKIIFFLLLIINGGKDEGLEVNNT
ncbi:hypothetical protein AOQ65_06575 [Bacteroides fragilis]|uniref:Uncharacterized protein n=1 Tax=Bacteroides fragilis 3_1_12 TaxID=457424 RepID=A0ABN0BQI9_BACFG|nr:hypothetical protein BFAG_03900 [Bacteroides fragilis 3_1_12]OCL21027.1 hypothetical protein AOQ65_06575 [Bacteroides fragilis]OCM98432.1 hypothetical protein AE749_12200 [Bacteroides fragilis]